MAELPTYEELEKRVKALEKEKQGRKQAEKALRESEEKLRTIFESANDEIIYLDVNGTIIDVNNKILDIFGYKREEVIGKNFTEFEFVKSESMQKTVNHFKNATSGKIASLMEFEAMRKDKTPVFIEVNTKLIKKDGDIKGLIHVIRDITDRKRAEEVLNERDEKLRAILSAVPDLMIVLDSEGRYIDIFTGSPDLLIAPAKELLGRTIHEVMPAERAQQIQDVIDRTLNTRESQYYEYDIETGDSKKWFAARIVAFKYQNLDCVLGSVREITDRKRAEKEHINHIRLQAVLETAGAACHELNQPMQAISGYSELLSMEVSEKDPLYEKVRNIKEQIDRMGKITGKLMGITRYETKVYNGEKKIIDLDNVRERRKYNRLIPCSRAFIITKSDSPKQYQIVDISMQGLSFWYNETQNQLDEFNELSINMPDENFYLDNIHCKTISDLTIADDSPTGSVSKQRCGVQFEDLNQNQRDQLEYFIKNYTITH